jgi:hypothetical protein
MEGWDLTLTIAGLSIASAAAVATLVDRYLTGEWWWQKIMLKPLPSQIPYPSREESPIPVHIFAPYCESPRKGLTYKSLPETLPAVYSPHKYSIVE